jgi:hypothetical protein
MLPMKKVAMALVPVLRTARIEFALTLIVIGIGVSIALSRLDELQAAARRVVDQLGATQNRAASNLDLAHCVFPFAASGAASFLCPSLTPRSIL